MACPAYAERTIIEVGLEELDAVTCLRTARTSGLTQIPVYEVFEGPALQINFQDRNRASGVLSPDFAAIGAATRTLAGQIYLYGSGIAQQPPSYFELIRACGFIEYRSSVIPCPTAATLAVTPTGADGFIEAGTYEYSFSMMYELDGTTIATTSALAVLESQVNDGEFVTAVVSASNHVDVSVLPATGIKRVYRRLAGETVWRYLGEVATTVTTYADTAANATIGLVHGPTAGAEQQANMGIDALVAPLFVTNSIKGAGGALPDYTWEYTFSMLYEADATTLAATASVVRYEGNKSASIASATTETTNNSVDLADLPITGRKRVYRRTNPDTRWHLIAEVDAATSIFADEGVGTVWGDPTEENMGVLAVDVADGTDGVLSGVLNQSVLVPAHNFDDFDALTIHGQLVELFKKPMTGTRGTMDFEAADGGNYIGRFNLTGVYGTNIAPDDPPSFIADPGLPPQFCGAEFYIYEESEAPTPRIPKVRAWGVTLGRTPGARYDGNASCANAGLREYVIGRKPDARWTTTIEENALWDWEADARASKKFALRLVAGTTVRQRVVFETYDANNPSSWSVPAVYYAQLIEAPSAGPTGDDGIRTVNLVFRLTGWEWLRIRHI